MLDRLSVPRRPFDFEDYIDILRRNARWILAPAFVCLVLATMVAFLIEDTYVSKALIRIVPQQVPESLVETTSSQQLADHINSMAETIESRNVLTSLITNYGLYRPELKHAPMEDVVNQMRPSIAIKPTLGLANVSNRNVPAFELRFSYRDRHLAQKVCSDLVSRFMDENLRDRMDNVTATNQFLNDEYDRAKHDLAVLEQKLTDFRIKNTGRLPEQMDMNLSQMNALETRLSSLSDQASRTNQQHMMLESNVRIAQDRLNAIKDISPQSQAHSDRVSELNRQMQTLETNIADMKDRYTESFPELQRARAQLAILKKQHDEASSEERAPTKDTTQESPMRSREKLDLQAAIEQLQTQVKANEIEAKQIAASIRTVTTNLQGYQGRMEGVPSGEKEYSELLRDRELAKTRYQELEMKRQKSSISMDMERRKQGETLEVLDAASLPDSPSAPKRSLIVTLGVVAGLLIGVFLVAIREVRNTSLKNLKDARLYTQLTILGSIPLLENDLVVQRRKQVMWVGWATAVLAGLVVMGGSIAHYYMNKV